MKQYLFAVFIFYCTYAVSAQPTWVSRFGEDRTYLFPPHDTVAGVLNLVAGASRDLFAIARVNREPTDKFYRIDTAGNVNPIWFAGHPGSGIQRELSQLLLATPDSGCIIVGTNTIYSAPNAPHAETWLSKVAKDATWLGWEWQFRSVRSHRFSLPTDITASPNGGFYVLFADTLVETNDTGLVIMQTATIKGSRLFVLPGGDFIVLDSTLKRQNLSGTVAWSIPCPTNMLTLNQGYVLGIDSATMFKIDVANGNTVWSYPCPFSPVSSMDKTPGGGFVASCGVQMNPWGNYVTAFQPGVLFEVDASGNVSWSENYSFPDHGLNKVVKLSDGRLATGGSYKYMHYYPTGIREYSSFAACLDSAGQGLLNTTSLTWPGDANYNDTLSFLDDALYVALALGTSGPARDDSLFWFDQGWYSSFAADWPTTFPGGLNHKHADCNGDGTVTPADFILYLNFATTSFVYMLPPVFIIPPWRLSSTASIGDLTLLPERDTVMAGDNIRFYLVAGSSGSAVDSIYGLSLVATLDTALLAGSPAITLLNSDFGIPSVSLSAYDFVANISTGGLNYETGYFAVVTHTDQQNVYGLSDTIAEINMASDPTITTTEILDFQFNGYSALTVSENPVVLNPIGGSVVITPAPVGIAEPSLSSMQVYPNPASDWLTVTFKSKSEKKVRLYNSLGVLVFETLAQDASLRVPVENLSEGLYALQIMQGSASRQLNFVVIH